MAVVKIGQQPHRRQAERAAIRRRHRFGEVRLEARIEIEPGGQPFPMGEVALDDVVNGGGDLGALGRRGIVGKHCRSGRQRLSNGSEPSAEREQRQADAYSSHRQAASAARLAASAGSHRSPLAISFALS